MHTPAITVIVVSLLAGCSSGEWVNGTHPSAYYARDDYECTQIAEAKLEKDRVSGYAAPAVAILGDVAKIAAEHDACMHARGWQLRTPKQHLVRSAQVPVTLYDADGGTKYVGSAFYDGTGHGSLSLVFKDGEILSGEYTTAVGSTSENRGTAVAIGDRGTRIRCEYTVDSQNHGRGHCLDKAGRTYDLLF